MTTCDWCGTSAIEVPPGGVCCEVDEPEMYLHGLDCRCLDCYLEWLSNPREEDEIEEARRERG